MDRNRVIGDATGIPWNLPADLKRFRKLTLSHAIVMGRTTFEHIGRPLDRRINIVLTRNPEYERDGIIVARSVEEAIRAAGQTHELMVIGGGEIYRAFLPLATYLYLTHVDGDCPGTVHFPEVNADEWREIHRESHDKDGKNQFPHEYVVSIRR